MTFHTHSAEETIELGEKIGALLQKGDIIALQGTLAAGKTTITKGIALALGVQDEITSPTFCLISEYEGKIPLYHMDVYRLDGGEDFINLGAEDLIYGNGVSLIEWSEKVMDELPKKTIILKLEAIEGTTERTITLDNWPHGQII
ncbi:MAG: tRNA (adenosine(37)-N6)-threonylcarbamoyltransferase complex ATPase subunit type 1 TsaE [Treponema sp.]|uniref:tRNA (adenosine(37)-N6)-threonylcarbamoyltransferase complex ATPase subunit type 1 TsaE n=1 Tax=Treponema sp. TaxID=166 RepID=UPI0025CD76F4|nr:tRNA (adenosine(37)-N6)-threonylcarbamoyltransferase complex ATPase subunit type 1 TsaE [Treponema sp.]MBQ9281357.1 tRNA (adenosine(37)-N6)-threonylcarbamoyltransferase complex ATPase subunit type 1 TsaE [Treponema sp.]